MEAKRVKKAQPTTASMSFSRRIITAAGQWRDVKSVKKWGAPRIRYVCLCACQHDCEFVYVCGASGIFAYQWFRVRVRVRVRVRARVRVRVRVRVSLRVSLRVRVRIVAYR